MKLIQDDFYYEYFADEFMGTEITFRKNKFTGDTMIFFTDEMAKQFFGFDSVETMLKNHKIKELMNQFYKETGQRLFMPDFEHGDTVMN
ncbi:MAG: hypothetical protein AB7S72_03390 [Draconibacterium sp.]